MLLRQTKSASGLLSPRDFRRALSPRLRRPQYLSEPEFSDHENSDSESEDMAASIIYSTARDAPKYKRKRYKSQRALSDSERPLGNRSRLGSVDETTARKKKKQQQQQLKSVATEDTATSSSKRSSARNQYSTDPMDWKAGAGAGAGEGDGRGGEEKDSGSRRTSASSSRQLSARKDNSQRRRNSEMRAVSSSHNIFDQDFDDDDDDSKLPPQTGWRDLFYEFLDQPRSSRIAFIYMAVIFIAILISVLNFLIESLPDFYGKNNTGIFVVESVVVFLFSFDYVAKFLCTRSVRWRWMLEFLNFIDLISIVPYYVELVVAATIGAGEGLSAFVVVRVLRLFRVFRIFKVAKYFKLLRIVAEALRRSTAGFILLLFTLALALVLFSSMEFYAEQTITRFDNIEPGATRLWYYATSAELNAWVASGRPNKLFTNEPGLALSAFQSVPDAMWWCLVTITTVGYGDRVPESGLGKMVASTTVVAGLLVLAFPLTIMGSNFNEVYAESLAADLKAAAKRYRSGKAPSMSREEALTNLERDFVSLRNQALDLRRATDDLLFRCDEVETLVATVVPPALSPNNVFSSRTSSMRSQSSAALQPPPSVRSSSADQKPLSKRNRKAQRELM